MRPGIHTESERGSGCRCRRRRCRRPRRIKAYTEKAFPFRRRLKSIPGWSGGGGWGSLAGGVTLAIRGSHVVRRRRRYCRQHRLWYSGCDFQVDPRRLVLLDDRHQGSVWKTSASGRAEDGTTARRGRRCERSGALFLNDPEIAVSCLVVRF